MKLSKIYFIVIMSPFLVNGQSFVNSSFETWDNPTLCAANTVPDNWLNYSDGGSAADKSDYTLCAHSIPGNASNGNVSARFVTYSASSGEGVYQNISNLSIGNQYVISFDYAGSNQYGGTSEINFKLFIDDINVASTPAFMPTKATWSNLQYTFTATSTTHKIGIRIRATSDPASGEAEADNFSILPSGQLSLISKIILDSDFSIYPNPSNGMTTLINKKSANSNVEIYNLAGELVFKTAMNHQKTIDLSNHPKGVYMVKMIDENESVIKEKIVLY
jgi:hypothetical protein